MANTVERGAGYEFVWRGDDMLNSVRNNSASGMHALQELALSVMNQLVPVDTGFLKSTIFSNVSREGNMLILTFGATAFYTIFVELGTSQHIAQPFIRPAADAVKSHAAQSFRQLRGSGGRFSGAAA